MDKRALINFFIVALCGSLASFSKDYWATGKFEKIFYAPIASVLTYLALNILFDSIPFLRGKKREYEGSWVECVQKNQDIYFSLFSIKYVNFKGYYELHGFTYTNGFKPYSTWKSVWIDLSDDKIDYIYEGRVIAQDYIKGYANFSVVLTDNMTNLEGRGYIIDLIKEPIRYEICVYKTNNDEKIKLIGSKSVSTPEDRVKFLTQYFKEHPERVMVIT